jgi:hypothetical protein
MEDILGDQRVVAKPAAKEISNIPVSTALFMY